MHTKPLHLIVFALLIGLVAACTTAPPAAPIDAPTALEEQVATEIPTELPTVTPEPTDTPTSEPTATDVPPTDTPEPTETATTAPTSPPTTAAVVNTAAPAATAQPAATQPVSAATQPQPQPQPTATTASSGGSTDDQTGRLFVLMCQGIEAQITFFYGGTMIHTASLHANATNGYIMQPGHYDVQYSARGYHNLNVSYDIEVGSGYVQWIGPSECAPENFYLDVITLP